MVDIILPIEQSDDPSAQREALAKALKVVPDRIQDFRLRKHSIDARQKQIKAQLRFEVGIDQALPPKVELKPDYPSISSNAASVIIVGCGPAGLFAGLRCLERAQTHSSGTRQGRIRPPL